MLWRTHFWPLEPLPRNRIFLRLLPPPLLFFFLTSNQPLLCVYCCCPDNSSLEGLTINSLTCIHHPPRGKSIGWGGWFFLVRLFSGFEMTTTQCSDYDGRGWDIEFHSIKAAHTRANGLAGSILVETISRGKRECLKWSERGVNEIRYVRKDEKG